MQDFDLNNAQDFDLHNNFNSLDRYIIDNDNKITEKAVTKNILEIIPFPLKCVNSQWIKWNSSRWITLSSQEINFIVGIAIDKVKQKYKNDEDISIEDLKKYANKYEKHSALKVIQDCLVSFGGCHLSLSDTNTNNLLLGVENGAIDLRTSELIIPRQEEYITKSTNLVYDPEACCEVWNKVISDVFYDDAEMMRYFQKVIGYSVCANPVEDLLFIPYGSGANGKSTVFNTISKALGDYSTTADISTFTTKRNGASARSDLIRLENRRVVITSEPDSDSALKESLIKSISGGDNIVARGLYSSDIEFTPSFTVFIPTNHLPIVKNMDYGLWRRLLPIPFERDFTNDTDVELDTSLSDKLDDELEGILKWIVQGSKMYLEEGLGEIPQKILQAKEHYRNGSDIVGQWLNDCCSINDDFEVSNTEIWSSYEIWSNEQGIKSIKDSVALGRLLAQKGYKSFNSRRISGRGRRGFRIRE